MSGNAFDTLAPNYDLDFTHTALGQMLRERVWAVLANHFRVGEHVLELACGTGEDALWLARRGIKVTATDGSAQMVAVAQRKAMQADMTQQVLVSQLQWADLPNFANLMGQTFDGAFCNFGGLNTTNGWASVAEALAALVKPGGAVILVPMGPHCPWELLWHALHADFATARRRYNQPAPAQLGDATISVWYPSASELLAAMRPWFTHRHTESLGLWLPPSYLSHLVNRWPKLFALFNRAEQLTARFSGGWGDHYISQFVRQ